MSRFEHLPFVCVARFALVALHGREKAFVLEAEACTLGRIFIHLHHTKIRTNHIIDLLLIITIKQ